MANTSSSVPRAALLAGALALLGTLTACEGSGGSATAPQRMPATSSPAADPADRTPPGSAPAEPAPSQKTPPEKAPSEKAPSTAEGGDGADRSRCHTAELRASVGRVDPGAGQRNFPVVLTNTSSRTCTVYGYPGAAFVDADGRQLGPDPKRGPGFTPATVTLDPGDSAWAGLSFASPQTSGARTATPAALLVTPPDERTSLKVTWKAGEVPVGGNESSVFLTVFAPGSGA
ncbi:DUF4232 domain-containing protein [Streptomyces sp. DH24]|uniref:DUF4232 domain-containing protein n=1 Tax=Streptomyces sp. DH24 TaxID=3040123 RepID=UPI0024432D8F|nr:DUF4232 domain-containing protein [Streptomyces sp. DH24]MDG9717334.1 DUF4232 domain-containing protein [Streptomyces sp. DH24]